MTKADPTPTYKQYPDKGCKYASSCLECPFDECMYDYPGGKQSWLKERRDKEIRRLFSKGKGIKELASMFQVAERTVYRAVRGG